MTDQNAQAMSSSLQDRIGRWAAVTPHAPAIEQGASRLDYAVLERRVNEIAALMLSLGARAGTLIVLDMARSIDLVAAMLATWRIDAAFLPLDPKWPSVRRQAILEDAAPALVLDAATVAQASGFASLPLRRRIHPADLAYVLYTSGSTGKPKGALVEHRQILNYVAAASAAMDLATARRWALIGSLAADLGYTALFGALHNGACLVIATDEQTQDAERFASFVRDNAIDALKIVPSHLQALLESRAPTVPRKLILGGEAASAALLERVRQIAPGCEIYNHYGPTETAVGVMIHKVSASTAAHGGLPLTTVLANCRVDVLDAELKSVPEGATGEVHIGGAQVCRGYVRGASDAFIADPTAHGERLYRTGDLAVRLPASGLRLVGRVDHQVKIRGFRVEPAEVEAALLGIDGVRQAAVIATSRKSREAGQEMQLRAVLAYDVAAFPGTDTERKQAIRAKLSAVLPDYMLPVDYVFLDSFPRLQNGKIDRLNLSASPEATATSELTAITPAEDELERALVERMAVLLGRDALGRNDDFFDHGGHSLLVIKLVAWLQRTYGIRIAPDVIFDCATPAALADHLRAHGVGSAEMPSLKEVRA